MTLSFVFRTDASLDIGTGHVMRCLTLADALSEAGARCRFVCRDLPGHLAGRIAGRGFRLDLLRGGGAAPRDDGPPHAGWLPVSQEDDAAQTAALLDESADWVVVDHYALDARWEGAIRAHVSKIMALDDLADRRHDVDLLLDQIPGHGEAEYRDLLDRACRCCFGPRYALLRPGFAVRREATLERRLAGTLAHVLVAMGGIDAAGATATALDALAGLGEGLRVTVAMGGASPALDAVRQRVAAMGGAARLVVDSDDMPALMQEADLAIGAAGTMSWERCCLGLPTLMLVLAGNQEETAAALAGAGAARALGRVTDADWPGRMLAALADLREPARLAAMAQAAAGICDGLGAVRVSTRLIAATVELRPAGIGDTARVWTWRHAGGAAALYRSGRETPLGDHERWFRAALQDPDRLLLIAEHQGRPVGHVRLDRMGGAGAERGEAKDAAVSICMDPEVRGRGIGGATLAAALLHARDRGFDRAVAEIHVENRASIRLFEKCGFSTSGREEPFVLATRCLTNL